MPRKVALFAIVSFLHSISVMSFARTRRVLQTKQSWGTMGRRLSTSWSSSLGNDNDASARRLIDLQKSTSQNPTFANSDEFIQHQRKVFDTMSDFFASQQTITPELVGTYQHLASTIVQATIQAQSFQSAKLKLLDVACGTGALIGFLKQAVQAQGTPPCRLAITGVDLSPQMIAGAQKHAEHFRDDSTSVELVESNILDFRSHERFDAVIMNACYGNFLNGTEVLTHVADHLVRRPTINATGGLAIISHPLGAQFVADLHAQDPATVPNLLPKKDQLTEQIRYLPLRLDTFIEQLVIEGNSIPFYLAVLARVRRVVLRTVLRFRGKVEAGFGRGGKKLGFPTANLSPIHFQEALKHVDTGVYFGWAVIERGEWLVRKAVVNIGYSPTFEGQENTGKIVEAHLILDDNDNVLDFYGQTMRLQLNGFLRPEFKFPSFPALIAQITADRDEAKVSLDEEPYLTFQQDTFLSAAGWVGRSGGDESMSWEFQDTNIAIGELK